MILRGKSKLSKRILIIGAGREQVKAYQKAKEMDLTVVGTDINPNAPAFEFADEKLICSTRDAIETLKKVESYSAKNPINGVMTIANDVPLTVSLISERLGLPGISTNSARIVSNKVLMKNQFIKFGIPTPKFQILENKEEFLDCRRKSTFPVILKPSDGRGSRGVLFIDEKTDISWAWQHCLENSQNKILLLENYVEGDQLSVEGILYDSKYHALAFADRNYKNLEKTKPFIVEDGGLIPSKYNGIILDKISQIIEDGAKSLGIDWGSLKADIVLSKEGPMIIELAARLSGNYLATHHIPLAYGIDIVSIMIHLSLGDSIEISILKPKFKKFLGVRYFFPPSGTIEKIKGLKQVKNYSYTKFLEIFRKEGDFQPPIENNTLRAGTIVCEGNTCEEAIQRTEEAVKNINFIIS